MLKTLLILAQISEGQLNIPKGQLTDNTVKTVLQIVFSVLGALAVFMIVFGGFKFVTSHGDPQATAKARNTVIYALIGLVVALLAFSIVTFVLDRVT